VGVFDGGGRLLRLRSSNAIAGHVVGAEAPGEVLERCFYTEPRECVRHSAREVPNSEAARNLQRSSAEVESGVGSTLRHQWCDESHGGGGALVVFRVDALSGSGRFYAAEPGQAIMAGAPVHESPGPLRIRTSATASFPPFLSDTMRGGAEM